MSTATRTLVESIELAQEHADDLSDSLVIIGDHLRWPDENPGAAREQIATAQGELLRLLFWLRAIARDAHQLNRDGDGGGPDGGTRAPAPVVELREVGT